MDEPRWPVWADQARSAGVGSSLSIGLPIQEAVVGALNVYGGGAHAFDRAAASAAEGFAAYAAVALANAHLYDSAATLSEQMRAAIQSRAVLEQAKGMIMAERRCSSDEAFGLLSKLSQDTNRKARDVAELLVANAVRKPDR
ncbi:ANTAR domain-containing protein [Micromonospora chersina]|uniref:ANTAR domain-containing protein n=1 Tax=Micromonospora chersina TaxID=47854 RepID=UPI00371AC23E